MTNARRRSTHTRNGRFVCGEGAYSTSVRLIAAPGLFRQATLRIAAKYSEAVGNMKFGDTKRFWVIFDTCTKPMYYRDLHNLVALPEGATLRYEYRATWLTADALKATGDENLRPSKVVLVYAQSRSYVRGNANPGAPAAFGEWLWIPTRLAHLRLIPPAEGGNHFFDLCVGSYPKVDDEALVRIVRPLSQSGDVPPSKWVALSDHVDALAALERGDASGNWPEIVNRLTELPSQFAGDSFWRIHSPTKAGSQDALPLRLRGAAGPFPWQTDGPRVDSVYHVNQAQRFAVRISTHTAAAVSTTRGKQVEVDAGAGGAVQVEGQNRLELRRYTSQIVHLRAASYDDLWTTEAGVAFKTLPEEVPVSGPTLILNFRVAKQQWRAIGGVIVAAFGFAATALPADSFKEEVLGTFLLRALGFVAIALGAKLVFGRLTFRP